MAQFSQRSRQIILLLGLKLDILLALAAIALVSWAAQRKAGFGLLTCYALSFTLLVESINGLPRQARSIAPPSRGHCRGWWRHWGLGGPNTSTNSCTGLVQSCTTDKLVTFLVIWSRRQSHADLARSRRKSPL